MSKETRVLYNEDCPVCRFEIHHYRDYASSASLPIRFEDIKSDLSDWGISADTAARRLHVLQDGEVISGIPAFVALWRSMPKYHWLARVVSLPIINRIAVLTYDYVLAALIYRWHLRRTNRSAKLAKID